LVIKRFYNPFLKIISTGECSKIDKEKLSLQKRGISTGTFLKFKIVKNRFDVNAGQLLLQQRSRTSWRPHWIPAHSFPVERLGKKMCPKKSHVAYQKPLFENFIQV